MTVFKQIVGRGSLVHEDTKNVYFSVVDFRGATSHFADPDFDGEPVQIYEPGPDDTVALPDDVPPPNNSGGALPGAPGDDEALVDGHPTLRFPPGGGDPRKKIYVDGGGVTIVTERVEYLGENGKLVTENLPDFTKAASRRR